MTTNNSHTSEMGLLQGSFFSPHKLWAHPAENDGSLFNNLQFWPFLYIHHTLLNILTCSKQGCALEYGFSGGFKKKPKLEKKEDSLGLT